MHGSLSMNGTKDMMCHVHPGHVSVRAEDTCFDTGDLDDGMVRSQNGEQ